jgi:hypothetical protein
MEALQVNPTTGFLEARSPGGFTFTSDKKLKLLELARAFCDKEQVPSIASLCDAVGVKIVTFYQHLRMDEAFADAWSEIKARTEDWLIQSLGVKARSANGVVANLALLRDVNPGRWNPEARIVHSTDTVQVKDLNRGISTVFEAEIVNNTNKPSNNQLK